jgi:hypothetical protein
VEKGGESNVLKALEKGKAGKVEIGKRGAGICFFSHEANRRK